MPGEIRPRNFCDADSSENSDRVGWSFKKRMDGEETSPVRDVTGGGRNTWKWVIRGNLMRTKDKIRRIFASVSRRLRAMV